MKTAIIFTLLTILGSLCQGKPVDKKKKLKDQPKQGKISILDFQTSESRALPFARPTY